MGAKKKCHLSKPIGIGKDFLRVTTELNKRQPGKGSMGGEGIYEAKATR